MNCLYDGILNNSPILFSELSPMPILDHAQMAKLLGDASHAGDLDAVLLLLAHGAEPDGRGREQAFTPLGKAAIVGNIDCANALIDAGASLDLAGNINCTPLMAAARHGREDMLSLLLNRGASCDYSDQHVFQTALSLGVERANSACVELLLVAGANPNCHQKAAGHASLLHLLAESGNSQLIELLLRFGADANRLDHDGRTPLMKAAFAGHGQAALLLLANTANVAQVDQQKLSALSYATKTMIDPYLSDFRQAIQLKLAIEEAQAISDALGPAPAPSKRRSQAL